MNERERVYEWRLTYPIRWDWTVRLWIERDVEHGGVESFDEADELVRSVLYKLGKSNDWMEKEDIASHLIEAVPQANSVEVCDNEGFGACVHRDWP